MSSTGLEPIAPSEAVDWYLEHRHEELRSATRRALKSSLAAFQEWTSEACVDELNDLGGRQLLEFKTWRKTESEINTVTLNGNLAILRRFLRFCERIDAVEEGLAERVPLPNVPPDEEVKEDVPDDHVVEGVRSYLDQYHYASRANVEIELVAEIGLRLGAIRAIDLDDLRLSDGVVHLRHRPEDSDDYGTPLKNGRSGERVVNLSPELVSLLEDYQTHPRQDTTDRFGRDPLLTTVKGRISTTTVRRDFYKASRPCEYRSDCPHDRQPSECIATAAPKAWDCPTSFSTHPLRKWSIMNQLDEGVPKELLSDRVDVSVPVLDKHYDQRSEQRKSRQRREVLEESLDRYR